MACMHRQLLHEDDKAQRSPPLLEVCMPMHMQAAASLTLHHTLSSCAMARPCMHRQLLHEDKEAQRSPPVLEISPNLSREQLVVSFVLQCYAFEANLLNHAAACGRFEPGGAW
eukprot:1161896-Pelagomonas_calceolata.AAC.4